MAAADLSVLDSLIERRFRLPDPLWEQIQLLLPTHSPSPLGGRPRADDRRCMEAILYVLITGIQWRGLPRCYGPATTAHDRFQEWARAGIFECLWEQALLHYDREVGLRWTWQSMDGAMTKAPLGGECTGPNPTDRAKQGVKRSLQTDAAGIPIGLAIAPANRNDCKLVGATLESRPVLPPPGTSQHICLDKGYDFLEVREVVEANGFVAHIRSRGGGEDRDGAQPQASSVGGRAYPLRDESVPTPPHPLGEEGRQLPRARPVRLRVDHRSRRATVVNPAFKVGTPLGHA